MSNTELIEAMHNLRKSIDSLTTIHRDIFDVDTSHDDITSLRGEMALLIESNKELRESIRFLKAAVNDLLNDIKKPS